MVNESRNVQIGHDAADNIIITGDGNVVVIHATKRIETELPPVAAGLPNPYKGLASFQETDANVFFGREKLIKNLWDRFRNLHETQPSSTRSFRILPILGPSGSGKSSVVRAGLIPELARSPIPGQNSSRIAVFSPGAHPLEALASVLARVVTKDELPVAKSRELTEELKIKSGQGVYDGLRRITAAIPDIDDSRLIIFVDQFEEIYSQCEDEEQVEAFIGNLLEAAGDRAGDVSIILTLRTDFIGETARNEVFNQVIAEGIIVPIMSPEELRKAIAEPAKSAGHALDNSVIDLLISQAKNREGVLPLLQFALTRIWEGIVRGVDPGVTLEEIGGVGGALASEAQRLYDDLKSDDDKEIARRAFIKLIRVGADIPVTRRTLPLADIVAHDEDIKHVKNILARFASPGARIITLSAKDDGSEIAKISHEALIEHWQQLDDWIKTAYNDLLFQYRLEDASQRWNSQKRPRGLLWRPPDLDQLRVFRQSENCDMTDLQIAFSDASERAFLLERIFNFGSMASTGLLALIAMAFLFWMFFSGDGKVAKNTNEIPVPPPTNQNVQNDNLDANGSDSDRTEDIFDPPEMTPERIAALEKINSEIKYALDFLKQKFNSEATSEITMSGKLLKDGLSSMWDPRENLVRAPAYTQDYPEMIYHEVAHPFISKLAPNLDRDNKGQTGSIRESYADIYAQIVKQKKLGQTAGEFDWIGPGGSMKDPQIKHMKDYGKTNSPDPYSQIHYNKGIPNKAFYETAIAIGSDKADDIWTRVMPKLKSQAKFQDLANETYKAAGELYSKNGAEQQAVRSAWQIVGISIR